MAKKFFYVCAGIALLALAYNLGSASASASSKGVTAEVAVLTGYLVDGQQIPLPTYEDGTVAVESECRWIVSPHYIRIRDVDGFTCLTREGRMVEVRGGKGPNGADFMIVAVRGSKRKADSFDPAKNPYR